MISKTDILKMVRKVTKRGQGYKERKLMDPHREWFIGVGLFMVISIIGGVVNARNYVHYNTLEHEIDHTTAPIKKYREATAVEAIELYAEKRTRFEALAADVPFVPETSTSTATSSDDAATSTDAGTENEAAGTSTAPETIQNDSGTTTLISE